MDQLTVIAVVMAAILFTWVGYFIGNFLPLGGRSQSKIRIDKSSVEDKKGPSIIEKITGLFNKDNEEIAETVASPLPSQDTFHDENKIARVKLRELTHIWYDRSERKLFADFHGTVIDLDKRINPEQHSQLSWLLLDLQDKVGISAELRSIIEERVGDAFPEKDEDEVVRQSFNPVKALINYVQSDVPKLGEKKDSIPYQINEILQKKIKGTPLEKLGISISEWPNRGVIFIIGVDVYSDIHEIPDPRIQYYIQQAVKEWDSKENEE